MSAASGADAEIKFIAPDTTSLRELTVPQFWFTSANYLRLLLPEIVPEALNKIIYLDSDILVRADLGRLWAQDTQGRALLAGRDPVIPTVSSLLGLPNYAQLGLPPDTPYFNSGVLVLDLACWRRQDIGRRVIRYIHDQAAIIKYADQDGMNAVLAHEWGPLDPQWNLMANFVWPNRWLPEDQKPAGRAMQPLLRGPHLLHFAGDSKPWWPSCDYPAKSDWLRALWRSRWFTAAERVHWFARYHLQHHQLRLQRRFGREQDA